MISRLLLCLVLLFGGGTGVWADITTGLVSRWCFDEGTGTTARDYVANSNPGTLINTPTWIPGRIGASALQFVAASVQRVEVADAPSLDITGEVSLAAWANLGSLAAGQFLVTKTAGGVDVNYGLSVATTGNMQFYFTNPSNTYHIMNTSGLGLTTGVWHHYLATYKLSTNTITLYLDGTARTTTTGAGSPTTTALLTNAGILSLGSFDGPTNPSTASLDEVQIFTRALTSTDAAELAGVTRCAKTRKLFHP